MSVRHCEEEIKCYPHHTSQAAAQGIQAHLNAGGDRADPVDTVHDAFAILSAGA